MGESKAARVLLCQCGQRMKLPADAKGKSFKCVRCGAILATASPPEENANARSSSDRDRIGALLLEEGLVTPEQLQQALAQQEAQGGKTLEILLSLGHLDKNRLHALLSRQPGVATIDLSRLSIDQELVELIPKQLAIEQLVLPIDRLGKLLTVAMACPLDTLTIGEVERITGLRVKAMLCKYDDILLSVKKHYRESEPLALEPAQFAHLGGAAKPATREDVGPRLESIAKLAVSRRSVSRLEAMGTGVEAVEELSALAEEDPGCAANLLILANSSLYELEERVDGVALAAALVGVEAARAWMLGAPVMPDSVAARVLPAAGRAAACARALAGACNVAPPVAGLAALLTASGRLALAMLLPDPCAAIDPKLAGRALLSAEKRLFSHGHTECAVVLLRRWQFPESLVDAVTYYLTPEKSLRFSRLTCVTALAVGLSDNQGDQETVLKADPFPWALAQLQMNESQVLSLSSRAAKS